MITTDSAILLAPATGEPRRCNYIGLSPVNSNFSCCNWSEFSYLYWL